VFLNSLFQALHNKDASYDQGSRVAGASSFTEDVLAEPYSARESKTINGKSYSASRQKVVRLSLEDIIHPEHFALRILDVYT
jgi:hypothetical protein